MHVKVVDEETNNKHAVKVIMTLLRTFTKFIVTIKLKLIFFVNLFFVVKNCTHHMIVLVFNMHIVCLEIFRNVACAKAFCHFMFLVQRCAQT